MKPSPNHALQRTAPCVTAPASAFALPPTMQVPRRTPRSLSLGSLGLMSASPKITFGDEDSQITTWLELGTALMTEVLGYLPRYESFYPDDEVFRLSRTQVEQRIHEAEAPHLFEIEAAIDEWLDTGAWRPVSDEAASLLRMRFEAAIDFCLQMHLPEAQGSTTIVPFPEMEISRIVRWIVVDWWKTYGCRKILGDMML